MPNPSRPESASDERSPDAAGAGPDAEEETERDAGALRTALGALRARLPPSFDSFEDDHEDSTQTND
jgi:hypothetical protein